jgi:hypothetical protein
VPSACLRCSRGLSAYIWGGCRWDGAPLVKTKVRFRITVMGEHEGPVAAARPCLPTQQDHVPPWPHPGNKTINETPHAHHGSRTGLFYVLLLLLTGHPLAILVLGGRGGRHPDWARNMRLEEACDMRRVGGHTDTACSRPSSGYHQNHTHTARTQV